MISLGKTHIDASESMTSPEESHIDIDKIPGRARRTQFFLMKLNNAWPGALDKGFDVYFYLWYIKTMDYALEERIGDPDLFTGRKEELAYFLKWITDIKKRKSQQACLFCFLEW